MITQTAEYALRAVVYLAMRPDSQPASALEISEAVRVPVGYLQKILRMLARQGILSAQRGSGGGFAMAKVATAISVLDILDATDSGPQRIERCPLGIKGHTNLCTLHRLLDNQIARAEQTFAQTSIADLVDGSSGIRPLCDAAGGFPVALDVSAGARRQEPK
jgi:Rrf2 family protein